MVCVVALLTILVTLSSISLGVNPTLCIMLTTLPNDLEWRKTTWQWFLSLLPKFWSSPPSINVHFRQICYEAQLTVACNYLWVDPWRLPDKDRNVWVVLLHNRIWLRKKLPTIDMEISLRLNFSIFASVSSPRWVPCSCAGLASLAEEESQFLQTGKEYIFWCHEV